MEKIRAILESLHTKYNFHKLFAGILLLANTLYICYLLIIAHHNVILLDDYAFMAKYKQYGILSSVSWWYQYWQGRFSPQLLTNIVIRTYESIHSLLPYSLILISLFIYTIVKIIKQLLPTVPEHSQYHKFLILNFSVFLFNFFLISNFEFSTFYWTNVSAMYFGGIAFALLGLGEMISKAKSIFSYFLIFIGFAFAGSSAENFGAMCLLLLSVYTTFLILKSKISESDILTKNYITKALFALIICATSFSVMIFAPGTDVRRSYFPTASISETSAVGLRSFFNLFKVIIAEKAQYFFLLSFPFIYWGTLLRKNQTVDEFSACLIVVISLPLFLIFLYVCHIPSAYAVSDIGPFRALTHIAFYLVSYIAIISFLIGFKTMFPKKLAFTVSIICCLSFIIISGSRLKKNVPATIAFSQSEKDRIRILLDQKLVKNKKAVILDSLYQSTNNVLWYHEIASDSTDKNSYWINQNISDGLKLGFEIKVRGR